MKFNTSTTLALAGVIVLLSFGITTAQEREGTAGSTDREGAARRGAERAGESLQAFRPQTEREAALYRMLLNLQREVAALRQQVQARDGSPPRGEGYAQREGYSRRDGDAPQSEGSARRDGDPPRSEGYAQREGYSRRDGDAPRSEGSARRDGDPPRSEGYAQREGYSRRDGDAPRSEGSARRDGDPPRSEGYAQREGYPRRDGDAPRSEGSARRDGDPPRSEGYAQREGYSRRDGDAPRSEGSAQRDGDPPRSEGYAQREGYPRRDGDANRTSRPDNAAIAKVKSQFQAYDKDSNGAVSFEERLAMRNYEVTGQRLLNERLYHLHEDINRDGSISIEEFAASRSRKGQRWLTFQLLEVNADRRVISVQSRGGDGNSAGGETHSVSVEPKAVITVKGRESKLSDLHNGQPVYLFMSHDKKSVIGLTQR